MHIPPEKQSKSIREEQDCPGWKCTLLIANLSVGEVGFFKFPGLWGEKHHETLAQTTPKNVTR